MIQQESRLKIADNSGAKKYFVSKSSEALKDDTQASGMYLWQRSKMPFPALKLKKVTLLSVLLFEQRKNADDQMVPIFDLMRMQLY